MIRVQGMNFVNFDQVLTVFAATQFGRSNQLDRGLKIYYINTQ